MKWIRHQLKQKNLKRKIYTIETGFRWEGRRALPKFTTNNHLDKVNALVVEGFREACRLGDVSHRKKGLLDLDGAAAHGV